MMSKKLKRTGNQNLIVGSSLLDADGSGDGSVGSMHSADCNIVGITLRNMPIARRLIFWYRLALQKSVMQTVISAKAPFRTMASKWVLLREVTISKAVVAMCSSNAHVRVTPPRHDWRTYR